MFLKWRISGDDIPFFKHVLDPPDTMLTVVGQEFTESIKGSLNYELIYSGNDGESIHVSYREFTPDDLARTAFYQDLIYKASENVMQFRKHVIRIHSVNNQSITYSVEEDGL